MKRETKIRIFSIVCLIITFSMIFISYQQNKKIEQEKLEREWITEDVCFRYNLTYSHYKEWTMNNEDLTYVVCVDYSRFNQGELVFIPY